MELSEYHFLLNSMQRADSNEASSDTPNESTMTHLQAGVVECGEERRRVAEPERVRALGQVDLVRHLEPVNVR